MKITPDHDADVQFYPADGVDPVRCCAIYARRSHKDGAGSDRNGRSLAEQESDDRDLAKRQGLTVVAVFREREGTGASVRSRKPRPAWEAALSALDGGGLFHTLIVWALDRADRRGAVEIGKLLDAHGDGSRRVLGVDGTDTSDPKRRMEIILRAEIAREEAERIGDRVARAKRFARDEGRWLGGPAPWGLRIDSGKLAHHPDTYPAARTVAEELLEGVTLWECVRRMNTSGVQSPGGKEWSVGSLSHVVRSPGWAGLQSIRGRTASGGWKGIAEVYVNAAGETVSVGEGVITPGERARILALIDERSAVLPEAIKAFRAGLKVTEVGKRLPATFLGIVLRCATCSGKTGMSGNRATYRYYRCMATSRGQSCAGFNAPMGAADDAVAVAFLKRVAALEPGDPLLEAIADAWTAQHDPEAVAKHQAAKDALVAAQAQKQRVMTLLTSGVFTEDDAETMMPNVRAQVAAAEKRLAANPLPSTDITPLLDLVQSIEAWDALDIPEQRNLMHMAINEVRVSPALGRGRRFNPTARIVICWADGSTTRP